jgi:hypothetical protein
MGGRRLESRWAAFIASSMIKRESMTLIYKPDIVEYRMVKFARQLPWWSFLRVLSHFGHSFGAAKKVPSLHLTHRFAAF